MSATSRAVRRAVAHQDSGSFPSAANSGWRRETLELSSDAQQLVVLFPADETTAQAVEQLRHRGRHPVTRQEPPA